MGRRSTGSTTKTVGINMNIDLVNELEERAKALQISTSKYCKIVFAQWLESGKKLTLVEG